MRQFMELYIDEIETLLKKIQENQRPSIETAASTIAKSIENGGVLHVFGSGHSHMIAEDVFHRAGGLVCVNAMLEQSLMDLNVGRSMHLERLSGYAEVLLKGYDLRKGEVIVIISNSGMNAVPIEMALECKKRGLTVIALTNMDHTTKVTSRHPSGKKLYEVADLILDNGGVYGDAVLEMNPLRTKVGPTSTIGGLIVMQSVMITVIEQLLNKKVSVPVLISANTEDGEAHNRQLINAYEKRIRYLQNQSEEQ